MLHTRKKKFRNKKDMQKYMERIDRLKDYNSFLENGLWILEFTLEDDLLISYKTSEKLYDDFFNRLNER